VRRGEMRPQRLERDRVEAEVGKIEPHLGTIEHAHHDAFAMGRGRRGDAEVHFLSAHRVRNAAVLRQPALGDIETGHQLDAADHGVAQPRRHG
jgi:hypothetical protein